MDNRNVDVVPMFRGAHGTTADFYCRCCCAARNGTRARKGTLRSATSSASRGAGGRGGWHHVLVPRSATSYLERLRAELAEIRADMDALLDASTIAT